MKGSLKRSVLVLSMTLLGFSTMAQQLAPKEFTVSGKVKNGAKEKKSFY
jgi:hypothetical protein